MTSPPRVTFTQAARLLDVGPRSRRHAAIVLERGIPELAHLVLAGEVRVFHASVVAQLPARLQRRVAQAGAAALKAVATELQRAAPVPLLAWDKAILNAEALKFSLGQEGPTGFLDLFTSLRRTLAVSRALASKV